MTTKSDIYDLIDLPNDIKNIIYEYKTEFETHENKKRVLEELTDVNNYVFDFFNYERIFNYSKLLKLTLFCIPGKGWWFNTISNYDGEFISAKVGGIHHSLEMSELFNGSSYSILYYFDNDDY